MMTALLLLLGLQSDSVDLDMLSGGDGIVLLYRDPAGGVYLTSMGSDTTTIQLPTEASGVSLGSVLHQDHEYLILSALSPDAEEITLFVLDAEDLAVVSTRSITPAQLVPDYPGEIGIESPSLVRYSDTSDPDRYPVLSLILVPEGFSAKDVQVSIRMQFSASDPPEFLEVLAFKLPYSPNSAQCGPVRGSYGHALGASQSAGALGGGGGIIWMYSWMHRISGPPDPEIPGPLPHNFLYSGTAYETAPGLQALGSCADEAVLLWTDADEDNHFTTYGFDTSSPVSTADYPYTLYGVREVMTANPLDDGILLAWDYLGHVSVRHYQGGSWGDAVFVVEPPGSPFGSDIAVCSDGEDYWVAWFTCDMEAPDVQFLPRGSVTGISGEPSAGDGGLQMGLAPSPFTTELHVRYDFAIPGTVQLRICDLTGRVVDDLSPGWSPAGHHESVWSPSGERPSGCYLVLLRVGDQVLAQRCMLLRRP